MSENTIKSAVLKLDDTDLYYQVRGSGPWLVLLGAPMEAEAFSNLAELLAVDYTVLTTDPRGVGRSPLHNPEGESTPELRAEDLSHILDELKVDTAALFGSSGGAVTALAFVQSHRDQVHTVVAHEPPLVELLPDRIRQRSNTEKIIGAFKEHGALAAWSEFLSNAGIELPPEALQQMFGGEQTQAQVAEQRHFFLHEMKASTHWEPNLAKLRQSDTRLVIGLGTESVGQLCERTSTALAAAIGCELVSFAGDHTGFVDHPEEFALQLRAVFDAAPNTQTT